MTPQRNRIFVNLIMTSTVYSPSDPAYWNTLGLNDLKWRMSQKPNWGRAKNVVLFVGDGMGVSTVTAARILRGQKYGRPGEETVLNFERFPYVAQAKVGKRCLLNDIFIAAP